LYSAIIRNAETLEIPGPTLDFNDLGFLLLFDKNCTPGRVQFL